MTSSLVGSEMCIRDSFLTMGNVVLVAFGLGVWFSKVWAAGKGRGREGDGCLLYTSDAADDM
eukprot:4593563-Prorocentrum_lima.AAC.1